MAFVGNETTSLRAMLIDYGSHYSESSRCRVSLFFWVPKVGARGLFFLKSCVMGTLLVLRLVKRGARGRS